MRFLRPLLQAAKAHTGFTGLVPHPNPRTALTELYESTLTKLNQLPADFPYRTATTALTKQRLELVQAESDVNQLETKIGEGPIEWVIKQAEAENSLVDNMAKWKSWEPLETPAPAGQWEYAFKKP
ncbi:ETC complex I subunit conserved region-domain-containing protein [Catenaria anguillulae PL171]|uniref:ETC complex I subunit conserved region-domain-containing protein n=1 Tax=Catenaria anguillulae PL171 TaxID=765915 RepID=A0A1Y2HBI9_9FUNG|nr:ETC complex I subunit conserved region-domain-containing protein [Catenaria anguillulae PL171]